MALEGLAAVQARIQEIQQRFASVAPAPVATPAAASSTAAGSPDFATMLASASGAASATGSPSSTAQAFVATALAENGKPYVWGATAPIGDANPKAFDCSELTKWAAGRVGVTIPDGATAQYRYLRDRGATMPVDQALHTPGALLFHFGHEPGHGAGELSDADVAISLGDGVHTIEARGHKYGTGVFEATGQRAGFFNYAALIPGM